MRLAFDEIGQICVTLECDSGASGKLCKMSADGKAGVCAAGDKFCGLVSSVRGGYGAVVIRGFVTVPYTGAAPSVGFAGLSANGAGGVKADSTGNSYLIVARDTAANTVTFFM